MLINYSWIRNTWLAHSICTNEWQHSPNNVEPKQSHLLL